jgi:hypothetical protein
MATRFFSALPSINTQEGNYPSMELKIRATLPLTPNHLEFILEIGKAKLTFNRLLLKN